MNRKRILPVILIVAAIGVTVYYTVFRDRRVEGEELASGTVEATEASLGFQSAGRIDRIVPREGDRVKAGDELATLDRSELDARLAQAEAQLAAARALLAELNAGTRTEELAQARDALRAASQRQMDAQRDFERVQRLFEGGAVSQEAFDKAKLALDVSTSQRDQADQQVRLLEAGPRRERIAGQRAAVAQAQATVRQVEAMLSNTIIRAPFDGVVTVRDREPGETVGPGASVLTIMNLEDRWVRIYIREDRIGAVQLGQTATIHSDTYPEKSYTGTVSFISSEAEFTPRNVQTTEERVKLVYAVKVRVTGDPGNELKPGMPADVRLGQVPESPASGS